MVERGISCSLNAVAYSKFFTTLHCPLNVISHEKGGKQFIGLLMILRSTVTINHVVFLKQKSRRILYRQSSRLLVSQKLLQQKAVKQTQFD